MSQSNQDALDRFISSMEHWLRIRVQECMRCSACKHSVKPWASTCRNCGQANPARVSATAGIFLALGFAILTLTLSAVFVAC
jgi:hypothetical protein